MDVAQELLQCKGYNGFSYRDIADRGGIQAATIHYYFPTKGSGPPHCWDATESGSRSNAS